MSGGWTLETLKEHMEALLAGERELRRARREDDLIAREKASQAVDRRLESMNEFRDQLREQASTFVTREFIEEQLKLRDVYQKTVSERFERLERWQAKVLGACAFALL